jgi:hypothetical protein
MCHPPLKNYRKLGWCFRTPATFKQRDLARIQ